MNQKSNELNERFLYIDALKLIIDNSIEESVSRAFVLEELVKLGYSEVSATTAIDMLRNGYTITLRQGSSDLNVQPAGFFAYLDYIELKEARAASLQAQRTATKAFYLTIIAIFISIIIGILQIQFC